MKTITGVLIIVSFSCISFAQQTEQQIKEQVLNSIQSQLETTSSAVDQRVIQLDQRIQVLDNQIANAVNTAAKLTALTERVQVLEQKQHAFEEANLAIYKANYQAAVINLVSMDREIRPLTLFNSSREFFSTLEQTCNPTSFDGYSDWFKHYRSFIDAKRTSNASLNVVGNLLDLTNNLTSGAPLTGPITSTLFTSINDFIGTIGRRNTALIEQSKTMFALTMKVAQFTNDKNLIESEGEVINKELDELKSLYEGILLRNLNLLGITWDQYLVEYSNNLDGNQRLAFLNRLAARSSDHIAQANATNEAEWRSKIYQEMQEVQSIKIRFGVSTFKIKENILKFGALLTKYQNDSTLGAKVVELSGKLNALAASFESTFQPLEYIKSANRMYKVM